MRYTPVTQNLKRGCIMRKLLVASLGLALSAGSAFAADLGQPPLYKAPPPPPPATNWSGCYIDAGFGYGLWRQDHSTRDSETAEVLTPTVSTGGEGWLGRVGGGCDYEIGSRFVIGALADYDFRDLHGTFQDPFSGAIGTEKQRNAWAAGGRVGYLITPDLLSYVSGGYTEARFSAIDLSTAGETAGIPGHTYRGWFLGTGYEYSLSNSFISSFLPIPGLFWRTEYRFSEYRAVDVPIVSTGLASHMQNDVQTITSGLVWRFNLGNLAGSPGPGN